MKANEALRYGMWLSMVAAFLACSTSSSTPATSSTSPTPDASAVDGESDGAMPADGGPERPDCAISEADRDDAGFPRMTVDRTKLGEICWTPDAGRISYCATDEVCARYRLPEDPPSVLRCGPGCGAVTCPGEHRCTMSLSSTPSLGCDCP